MKYFTKTVKIKESEEGRLSRISRRLRIFNVAVFLPLLLVAPEVCAHPAPETAVVAVCPEAVPEHEPPALKTPAIGNRVEAASSACPRRDSVEDEHDEASNNDSASRGDDRQSSDCDDTPEDDDGETDADLRMRQLAAVSSALKTLMMSVPGTRHFLEKAQAMPEKTFEQRQAKASAIHEAQTLLAEQVALLAALKQALEAILQQEKVAADVKSIHDVFGSQIAEDVAILADVFDGLIAEGVESIINAFGEHIARDVKSILDVFGERVAPDVKFDPDLFVRE